MEKETDGVGERGQERLQEHWNSKLWSVQPSLQAESYSERKKESQVLEGIIQKPSGLIPEFQKQILDPTPGGSDSEGQEGGVCSSSQAVLIPKCEDQQACLYSDSLPAATKTDN